jgi:hypothetical protein
MSKRAVRYLSQADTQALLKWPEVIACLASAYERAGDPRAAPPKVVARSDGMWLRALTAISGSGAIMGAKIIAKGRPRGADHFTALWVRKAARSPACAQRTVSATYAGGAGILHRMVWKYQAWLNGFNGGPLRQPTMKIRDPHMCQLREGLKRSGLEVTADPDSEFFVGRNPV